MNTGIAAGAEANPHRLQQAVKWTVYVLLIINFGFYIAEDWNRAIHILTPASTFLNWAGEFATSIDESAWFVLLIMFELETYVLGDENLEGWIGHTVRGIRLLCFVMISHTVYAFAVALINIQPTVPVENVSGLCDMVNADVSYVYNLEYTQVTEQTCSGLSSASQFYWVANDPVVSSLAGLGLERDLVLADLVEAIIWLVIVLSIELVVRLQDRGMTGGTLIAGINKTKIFLYLVLIALGIYWAFLSHWLYLWDELVWIGGFAAIEKNVSDWRDELSEEVGTVLTE